MDSSQDYLLSMNLSRLDLHDKILDELLKSWALFLKLPPSDNAERTLDINAVGTSFEMFQTRRNVISQQIVSLGAISPESIQGPVREQSENHLEAAVLSKIDADLLPTIDSRTPQYAELRADLKASGERYAALVDTLKALEDKLPERLSVPFGPMNPEKQESLLDQLMDYLEAQGN